jgi:hypothetical protein
VVSDVLAICRSISQIFGFVRDNLSSLAPIRDRQTIGEIAPGAGLGLTARPVGVVMVWRCGLMLLAVAAFPANGQSTTNTQIWAEYMVNYPFANSFNVENAFAYSTVMGSPRWRAAYYTPTLEYALTQNIDLSGAATLSYTAQTESYNTFEVRPVIGTRIHFTPNRRILTRLYLRMEQRNFLNLDTYEWEHSLRSRIRAETLIPINKKSYYDDNLWYGIADVEFLFTSEDVAERFANRFRARMGIGFRLRYTSRFEVIYMAQKSRNGIDEDFSSSDQIFRIRYKQFLNKHKPTRMSGSGN